MNQGEPGRGCVGEPKRKTRNAQEACRRAIDGQVVVWGLRELEARRQAQEARRQVQEARSCPENDGVRRT